jgi:hypothetical protein
MTTQLLFGGIYSNSPSNSVASYNSLANYGTTWGAEDYYRKQVIPTGGTLSSWYIKLAAAPGAGKSFVFTVRLNGVSAALTITISDAATTGADITHSVAVVAGDIVDILATPSGTPSASTIPTWTMVFTPTIDNENIILSRGYCYNGGTRYYAAQGGRNGGSEYVSVNPIPCAGTAKKLYVDMAADAGAAPDAYTFALMKNGAGSALTTSVVADNTTGNDTAHTVDLAAGDTLCISIVPVSSPAVTGQIAAISWVFLSTTANESFVLGADSLNKPNVGTTEYVPLHDTEYDWSATEANRLSGGCQTPYKLKNFYVKFSSAPSGNYTLNVRGGGNNTGITVTILSGNTAGNDTAHTYDLVDYQTMSVSCLAAGSAIRVMFGICVYTAPAGWTNIGKINGIAATSIAKVNGIAVASIAKVNGVAV